MSTACYYNGVRLWQNGMTLRANPRTMVQNTKAGLARKKGRLYPRSPNSMYEIQVMTSIPPVTEIDTTVGRQATHHLYMLQTQKALVDQARAFGYVSWVVDDAFKNDVSSVAGTGASAVITLSSFAGFTPTVGCYVLVRNPTTGAGFVSPVTVVGSGPPYTIAVACQAPDLDRTLQDVTVTSAWDVLLTAYHFPYSQYMQVGWTETPSQGEDKHGTAQWRFISESDVVYDTSYALDLT